jgi:hypothetical protein
VALTTGWTAGRSRQVHISGIFPIEECDPRLRDFLGDTDVKK